jgi:Flp pilus assembly protein CpaB
MRKLRAFVALAVSLLLAFLVATVVYRQINKPHTAPKPQPASTPAPSPQHTFFSDSIPEGMRAFSLHTDQVSGLPGQIKAGDRVDIVATSPLPEKTGNITRVILQNIRILELDRPSAVGGLGQKSRERQWTISLLVTPAQGVTLAAASAASKIMLLTRNSSDEHNPTVASTAFTPETGAEPVEIDALSSWKNAIPKGMRAITVAVRDTDGMAGRLQKGDRVDVLVSCPYSRFSSGTLAPGSKGEVSQYRLSSRIVLQDIAVLATETEVTLQPGLPQPVRLISLLVTPTQAEQITVITDATTKAHIRLVNRNAGDRQKTATSGQLLSDILMPKQHQVKHEVIVHHGTQQTMEYFFD